MRRLGRFLAAELAPAQGRGGYTLHLTLSCALVITCFMTLQIPFLAVALIVVFYVSQPNVVMMALVGVVFFITISVTIGLVLLIFKYAYDYPLLRLIAATLLFSGALYLMRVLGKLGLAFFVVALALIYAQTFPSMTDQSEILVRLLLWLWAAINLAVLLTVLVNACFPDAYPARQFRSRLRALFRQAAGQLRGEPPMTAAALAARLPELQTLLKLGTLSSPQMRRDAGRWEALMVAAVRCAWLTLPRSAQPPSAQALALAATLTDLAEHLEPASIGPVSAEAEDENSALDREIAAVLAALAAGETLALPPECRAREPLLLPDAWTNPAYAHFTLKTLLATLVCYLFYTATDWQGIHTIMLSCVIVAQPGLGATMQKTLLRVAGALLATALALACIVFIQPHTESIVGLLAMALPVMALSAWLAAGSERIAYAGIQIAFTFSLAFLNWFGPLVNLTELRDRVIGILLGVLVSSLFHLYLWPDSEALRLRGRMAGLYRQIADYLTGAPRQSEIPLLLAINQTEGLMHRVRAEPLFAWAHPHPEARRWPLRRTWRLAQAIVRDGERLRALNSETALARAGGALKAYAAHIDDPQQALPTLPQSGGALERDIAALPDWRAADANRTDNS